ncbi:MAG: hypothetical protein ACLTHX_10100 [Blautia massiliensis (ex Durand et al. 2017)]|uniref:hypothetical protein n=1 Tax=Blautia massiliensis (ex Durand et al. 2017) TaxID=1737424 RepID=UPI003995B0AA
MQKCRSTCNGNFSSHTRGVGKAADPDLPVDALSAALLCADVWIEFNHQWLLYSTPFERAEAENKKCVTCVW